MLTICVLFPWNRPVFAQSRMALQAIHISVFVGSLPASTGCTVTVYFSVKFAGDDGTVWHPAHCDWNNPRPVAARVGSIAGKTAGHAGGCNVVNWVSILTRFGRSMLDI